MSTEFNKSLMHRHWVEHWNQGNLDSLDEIYAPDFVSHQTSGDITGIEGVRQFVTNFRAAFPDLQCTVEDMIATGDKVVTRWIIRGTHQNEFMGIPPTHQPVTVSGISINRFAKGQTVESWDEADVLGMMQQLGVVPQPTP